MLSNNLKRSVATLGVVAGLLAAAAPASAQVMPGTMGFTTPDDVPPAAMRSYTTGIYGLTGGNDTLRATVTCLDQDMSTVKAPVPASLVDYYGGVCYFHTP